MALHAAPPNHFLHQLFIMQRQGRRPLFMHGCASHEVRGSHSHVHCSMWLPLTNLVSNGSETRDVLLALGFAGTAVHFLYC